MYGFLYDRPPMVEVGLEVKYTSNLEIEMETDMQLRIVAMKKLTSKIRGIKFNVLRVKYLISKY